MSQTQPIEVFYFPTPNGKKITIMLEELGVPYHVNPVHIGRGDQFKPEYLEISPNNKIPAILDPEGPDGKPVSIFESGAILQYLAGKFGRFHGRDHRARIKVDQWLFWQVAGFGPLLGQNYFFAKDAPEKIPYAIERYRKETRRLYGVLNRQLDGRDHIADEFSIADIAVIDWSLYWDDLGVDPAEFPNVAAWQKRMQARPGVARGLAVKLPDGDAPDIENEEARRILYGQSSR
ncbi:glutathione S-transferase N-terminal domain-containing protein [Paracoccus sp. TOH]|uniref:glutathione S-transferase family protein n=1 Tax=Paracoccus sp. TOH TaxID=1263728 RepID=UPI0025B1F11F|nr:glutathione S-transferase N-terminal domain-containing protein [Paracoccus sp. TOH]WJS87192.1 glutathione S-transferase N-terminal domain-containing protein [Paracoccus sp. TOH]WJS87317.1 glutathione S-transferase N-terminal domain-containing protein [Paracoccus sp. TOH]